MTRRKLISLLLGFILLGFIIATNANYSIIVFPLFLIVFSIKDRIVPFFTKIPLPTMVLFLLIGLGISLILEWGVGIDELATNPGHSWFANWMGLVVFYGLWIMGSYLVISKFKLKPGGVFIGTSLFGIFVEQGFQFFQILASFNLFAILFWIVYVPIAYTPVILIPYLLLKERFKL